MISSILELSQKQNASGRRYIRWVVHEIQNDVTQWNKNGISWSEQYVLNNIETAKNMPIVVQFIDYNKSEPWGHGYLSEVKGNEPIFEDSVVVGVATDASIETVEVNGKSIRALVAEGYIFEQRYSAFVDWLKTEMFDGKLPETSVEICVKKDSNNEVIIYDGGWKEKGRVPMIYDYSGSAILGIEPSDDNAVLLELNSKFNKEEKMDKTENALIVELNGKVETKINEINTLNNKIKDFEVDIAKKDEKITELNSAINDAQKKSSENLESVTNELNTVKTALQDKESVISTLTSEVNELRQFKKITEDKALIAELNEALKDFTDKEKETVKSKVETFSAEPTKEKINEIVSEVNSFIAKTILENRKNKEAKSETNSAADVYGDILEINSDKTSISYEDLY
ncbi:coiled-coil domain-containing protein [Paenibacillus sp. FSL H3-0333]|uniref:coiled-coil domain-containing protein n=1 Tax=Paenibacillus sp. FSL H3-0333 TaxID=2921373 RepID=UPI0030F84C72